MRSAAVSIWEAFWPPQPPLGLTAGNGRVLLSQLHANSGVDAISKDPKSTWIPQLTLGSAEKVRTQFLSLRHLHDFVRQPTILDYFVRDSALLGPDAC